MTCFFRPCSLTLTHLFYVGFFKRRATKRSLHDWLPHLQDTLPQQLIEKPKTVMKRSHHVSKQFTKRTKVVKQWHKNKMWTSVCLPWTNKSRLAWCPCLLLYGPTWKDSPRPPPSPTTCWSPLQTRSLDETRVPLNTQACMRKCKRCIKLIKKISYGNIVLKNTLHSFF